MPTTAAGPAWVSTRSTRIPASFRPSTSTSLGHLRSAGTPAAPRRASATATPASSGSHGHCRGVPTGPQQHREGQRGPGRASPRPGRAGPGPAVWCSATTTSPSAAPARGPLGRRSALVEPASVDDLDVEPGHRAAARAASRGGRGAGSGFMGTRLAYADARRPENSERTTRRGTDVPTTIDIHTTAGKLADLERRLDEAVHAGSAKARREAARQGQQDRPRAHRAALRRGLLRRARRVRPAPLHRLRPGEEASLRRRRGHRLRHHRRPPGLRLHPGRHHLRRLARRGLRREDRQGHGLRHQDRLPDHRHQRGRRRPHPGGRRLARPLRRDLPPQRARLRA